MTTTDTMIYMNQSDLEQIGIDWRKQIRNIQKAVNCLHENDFAQPIKPYLRYKNASNRIIAMPAYLGGSYHIAGIKWIASFPDNIHRDIPRAHSVVILNDADTGRPVSIINTAMLSVIRTASVSGVILDQYDQYKKLNNFKLGISGFGPIGQYHLKMCLSLLGEKISEIVIFDIKEVSLEDVPSPYRSKIRIASNWQEAYENADVFITCTVSKAPYINIKPKEGSLQLNVSLRDYTTDIYEFVKGGIVVDEWEEVCRENTDIEMMHKHRGLEKADTYSISDVVCGSVMEKLVPHQTVMFNPMGMAIFDMAVGAYFLEKAFELQIGQRLA